MYAEHFFENQLDNSFFDFKYQYNEFKEYTLLYKCWFALKSLFYIVFSFLLILGAIYVLFDILNSFGLNLGFYTSYLQCNIYNGISSCSTYSTFHFYSQVFYFTIIPIAFIIEIQAILINSHYNAQKNLFKAQTKDKRLQAMFKSLQSIKNNSDDQALLESLQDFFSTLK